MKLKTEVFGRLVCCVVYGTGNVFLSFAVIRSQGPRGLTRRSAAASLLRCGFESHWGHGCLSVVNVVCCQVEVSATS